MATTQYAAEEIVGALEASAARTFQAGSYVPPIGFRHIPAGASYLDETGTGRVVNSYRPASGYGALPPARSMPLIRSSGVVGAPLVADSIISGAPRRSLSPGLYAPQITIRGVRAADGSPVRVRGVRAADGSPVRVNAVRVGSPSSSVVAPGYATSVSPAVNVVTRPGVSADRIGTGYSRLGEPVVRVGEPVVRVGDGRTTAGLRTVSAGLPVTSYAGAPRVVASGAAAAGHIVRQAPAENVVTYSGSPVYPRTTALSSPAYQLRAATSPADPLVVPARRPVTVTAAPSTTAVSRTYATSATSQATQSVEPIRMRHASADVYAKYRAEHRQPTVVRLGAAGR